MVDWRVIWGAPGWQLPAAAIAIVCALALVWGYWRVPGAAWLKGVCAALKLAALGLLVLCLMEPLYSGMRARPGANLFLVLADNSQSMEIRDRGQGLPRTALLRRQLKRDAAWFTRLGQDFDVRPYLFDHQLHAISEFAELDFEGRNSNLLAALATLKERFRDRPVAGILAFTDGNFTDIPTSGDTLSELLEGIAPVYPVPVGNAQPLRDIRLSRVAVRETNFEAAPIQLQAEVVSHGYADRPLRVELLTEAGDVVASEQFSGKDDVPHTVTLKTRPDRKGVVFYRVRAYCQQEAAAFDDPARIREATLENNQRYVMVDRGGGPFRVLYVAGRPNWEFKYLRRAMEEDDEVNLRAIIRIAKREPKFQFYAAGDANRFFKGFGNEGDEETERYDQPVLMRLGVDDQAELRGGFPKAAEDLFDYHALVLDDVEAEFFDRDQMSLVQRFVSQRGGGLLMLGGQESFAQGAYDRTPLGELLPVYVNTQPPEAGDAQYRLELTREGWFQSWVRVRSTEAEERQRLAEMPSFHTLNRVSSIKPGATILGEAVRQDGRHFPAMVSQPFGRGRAAALLIGDLWRWQMNKPAAEQSDLQVMWRQTVRWLVADVPQRVELTVQREPGSPGVRLLVTVRDRRFEPLDNATVTLQVEQPDKSEVKLTAAPHPAEPGAYLVEFTPKLSGPYRAEAIVADADGSDAGRREGGWISQPAAEEFQQLEVNRNQMAALADATAGEVVELSQLNQFVSQLPNRRVPQMESWIYPLWHQWQVLVLVVACLAGEWGLRRWKGLP